MTSNLEMMRKRFEYQGGIRQEDRMIQDKFRSFQKSLQYSYQGCNVKLEQPANFCINNDITVKYNKVWRALINPNKVKQDYDDKILSIGFEYGFKAGDVFEWVNTNTHWIIYLQELSELAYFRGDIRRCDYEIKWEDEDGLHSTYAAIRGPVETKIDYIQKHGISVDNPNHSLNILMPKNKDALEYFRRYSKFYLNDIDEGDEQVCWRVEAKDSISMPGVLEITAVEYYINKDEDDLENGIVGGLIVEPANPNEEEVEITITGETFIKPNQAYEYKYEGED